MGVNPFLAALGDVFQGISVDSERKRKLRKQEEDDLSREDQQMFQNQIALQQLGARPTSDMTSVLAALQPMEKRQMDIGTALTPQQLLEAAAVPVSTALSNRPGYEDVTKEQTLPSDISSMIADVSSNLRSPPLTLRGRNNTSTNFTVDPTQTQPALAAAAALKREIGTEARQQTQIDATEARAREHEQAVAKALADKNRSDDRGTLSGYQIDLPNDHPDKNLTVDQAAVKWGDISKYVDQANKARAAAVARDESAARIAEHHDARGQRLQAQYEKSMEQFAGYGQEIPNLIREITQDTSGKGFNRGASDNAIISFMAHLIDPKTGVRQSDVDNALRALGFANMAQNYLHRLKTGETLTPEFRQDILRLTLNVAETVKAQSDANDAHYQERAKKERIDGGYLTTVKMFPGVDIEGVGLKAGFPEYVQRQRDRVILGGYNPKGVP